MQIDSTAIVSKGAKLAKGVQIGPYTIIGNNVVIGSGTRLGAYCVIEGNTSIGKDCQIFTGAVLGSPPQDLKYKGEKSFLEIGNHNIIREYCTFNPGTGENGRTVVGNNNLFMAYAHIAHDCIVGDDCIIANNGTLAGHVTIEDRAVVGGFAAIHQFARVGRFSIIGGCSKVIQDIPPYSTCDGHPAVCYGLNLIGLRRNSIPRESINQLKQAFKVLFNSGLSTKHALEKLEKEIIKPVEEVLCLINFIKNSQRGVVHSCRSKRITLEQSADDIYR
ncbi:MAG: acyl-ACP--UDP-N-acetylglucosamine O-acyltransferase [Candidatus Omnitrophica bacterium]|nr:acyl-ACP--UDP-N-acetylglucosamine O-acyltransferase [Candidatus Omnitrophota bacterium]MBU4473137.1 acyl-ACP--UDP-N-acetylglucosamine O-acyltransferase [Candidatus Omnitrophota bacterium]MCG2706424.1 acyl-ACP--UDP-N-acetylglucosamine O-acyltransferase [Candidatus Omnitrophota bacterium]